MYIPFLSRCLANGLGIYNFRPLPWYTFVSYRKHKRNCHDNEPTAGWATRASFFNFLTNACARNGAPCPSLKFPSICWFSRWLIIYASNQSVAKRARRKTYAAGFFHLVSVCATLPKRPSTVFVMATAFNSAKMKEISMQVFTAFEWRGSSDIFLNEATLPRLLFLRVGIDRRLEKQMGYKSCHIKTAWGIRLIFRNLKPFPTLPLIKLCRRSCIKLQILNQRNVKV